MIVAVTGGRDYRDDDHVRRVLNEVHAESPISVLVHGACGLKIGRYGALDGRMRGADQAAHYWAISNDVMVRFYVADWERFGGPAGPRRNGLMLRAEKPDLLIAFPGGSGTQSAIDIALTLGLRVRDEREVTR